MKRILSALLTFAFFAGILAVATTSKRTVRAYAGGGCSVANLSGNYAFSQTGFEAKNTMGAPLPFATVGVSTPIPQGGLQVSAAASLILAH